MDSSDNPNLRIWVIGVAAFDPVLACRLPQIWVLIFKTKPSSTCRNILHYRTPSAPQLTSLPNGLMLVIPHSINEHQSMTAKVF